LLGSNLISRECAKRSRRVLNSYAGDAIVLQVVSVEMIVVPTG